MFKILLTVNLIAALILNPWAIPYSSDASTLLITLLHFINNQWIIFTLFIASARTSTYPIYNNKSLLFAKDASIKASNCKVVTSNLTYVSPLAGFSIC